MSIKYSGENVLTYLLNLLNTKFGTKVDKIDGKGLSTNDYTTAEKTKLSGVEANANNYTHPTNTPHTAGMYKITVDNNGHITNANAVVKSDITALGIPGSSPTLPTISIDVEADATSDTKTVSPKAVKNYVDGKVSATYKPAGNIAFASLPVLAENVLGNVYNVTDAFTTNNNFVEGAGNEYGAGTNVVVVYTNDTYKFDVLSGFVDLSGYTPTDEFVEYTNNEIDGFWDSVFNA